MSEQPNKNLLLGRYWLMADGELVPNIAGGSDDGDDDTSEVDKLTSQLKEARSDAAKNRKALKALNDKLEGVDLEQYSELMKSAEEARQKSEEEKGNYSKVLDDMKRNHEASLTKANDSASAWKKRFEEKAIDSELSAAAKTAVNSKAAVTLVRSEYDFNISEDGSIEIQKGGETIFDDNGKALTPASLMAKHLADNPYLVSASQNQGSGSQQQQRQKSTGDKSTGDKVRDGLSALLNA